MEDPLSQRLLRIGDALGQPVEWVGRVAAACVLLLVLLVAFNVLTRYLFEHSSVALQEMEWHLVSPIALIGMSYALRAGEHVRVDVLYDRLSDRMRHIVDLLSAFLMLCLAVIFVVLAMPYIQQSFSMLEGSPDPGGLPYRWILKAFIPIGFLLLALQGLSQICQSTAGILTPKTSSR